MLVPEDDLLVTATIYIASPPEAVWQVLTAFSHYAEWHPILSLEGAAPGLEPGARLPFQLSGGTAGEQAFVAEVTEVAPPHLLGWQGGAVGVFFGRHTFKLQAHPGGGTRYTETERWSGTMAASVIAEHRADLEQEYERIVAALKEQAERAHAG